MRKFVSLLTLLVLAVVGAGSVSAQTYTNKVIVAFGDPVMSVAELVDGGHYVLKSYGRHANDDQYVYEAEDFHLRMASAAEDSPATFVFTFHKVDEGVFTISTATGRWIPDYTTNAAMFSGETPAEITITDITDDEEAPTGQFNLQLPSGIWIDANAADMASWSSKSSMNGNGAYTITAVEIGDETDEVYLQRVISEINFDASEWPVGTEGGYYPQSLIDDCQAAYDYANTMLDELPETGMREAADALVAAYEALKKGQIPVVFNAGYYYLLNVRDTTSGDLIPDLSATTDLDAAYADGTNLLWSLHFDATVGGAEAEPQYIWQFETASDTSYYVKSVGYNAYVNSTLGFTPNKEDACEFRVQTATTPGGFVSIENLTTVGRGWHAQVNGKRVVNYSITAGASGWKPIAVSAETVAAVAGKCEELQKTFKQSLLNDTLQKYYNLALEAQAAGKSYKLDGGTYDGVFTVGDGLLTDAAQVISNVCDPDEGSYDGLFDGDFSSFFHTSWHASVPADEPHYLQMDLGKEVQTLVLKYAERSANASTPDLPYEVSIYATNDANLLTKVAEVEDPETGEIVEELVNVPSEQWTKINDVVFDWSQVLKDEEGNEVTVTKRTASPILNGAGLTMLELGGKYRYVRIAVGKNMQHAVAGSARSNGDGYDYWNLSELRAYEATYDPNCVYAHMDAAAVASLESNIAKAATELKAEAATQATIDALKAAYEAFLAVYPDKNKLQAAIEDAQSWIDSAVEGTDAGYFQTGAIDALQGIVDAANTVNASTLTYEAYNKAMTDLESGVKTFNGKLIMPAEGLYVIRSASEGGNHNDDAALRTDPGDCVAYALNHADDGTGLRWGYADDTDVSFRGNAQWVLKKVDGGFTLRNLATGLYMANTQTKLSNNIGQSAEPAVIGLRYARTEGAFNLVISEGLFANAQPTAGGDGPLVVWSSAQGRDNSAFMFEPTTYQATVKMDIAPNVPSVMTMPFDVDIKSAEFTPYTISGKFNHGAFEAVELVEISGDVLPAGTPFVVYETEDDFTEVSIFPTVLDNYADIAYVTEAKKFEGFYGTLAPDTVAVGLVWANDSLSARTDLAVPAYSGYINYGQLPAASAAGSVSLPVTTAVAVGIATVQTEQGAVATRKQGVFTLQGVRVNNTRNLPKGVYIINGRKVIRK